MTRSKQARTGFRQDTHQDTVASVLITSFHSKLPLFASALLSLDAWHVRIIDPTTSTFRNEFSLDKGTACRCLSWGSQPGSQKVEKSKKKRKVEHDREGGLLAVGTNDGAILLFSLAEDKLIAKLTGGHTGEVLAVTFAESSLWSAGSDGKVTEWDTNTHAIIQYGAAISHDPTHHSRSLTVDSSNALKSIAVSLPTVLAASYTIHELTPPSAEKVNSYTAHTSPVHTLQFGPDRCFVSAAEDDRFINVFSLAEGTTIRSLVADSDVRQFVQNEQVLCAVNAGGQIELFSNPFAPLTQNPGKRKKMITTNATSKISVLRPEGTIVEVVSVSLRDDLLILAWMEGQKIVFETIKVIEAGGNVIDSIEIVRSKQSKAAQVNGFKEQRVYQDANANVVSGEQTADTEMDGIAITNGQADEGEEKTDGDEEEEEEDEEPPEPSLAQRLHALEVSNTTVSSKPASSKTVLSMPSANSLSTVLTQALRSNDMALLESCLHHTDPKVILATIRRLDPTLAANLLNQLAIRISRKPGRSTMLGVWVRWSIVVHGGFLATLPDLVQTLSNLHNVLSARAATLPRLLALQGRLDMVHSQIELRREGGTRTNTGEDPSDVEYNEGESDEEIGIEDASQIGGVESSDEEDEDEDDEDEEEEDDDGEDGDEEVGAEGEDSESEIGDEAVDGTLGDSEDDLVITNGVESDSEDEADEEDNA